MSDKNNLSLENRVKNLIITRLKLKLKPDDIDNNQPIFDEGLGLDSIDALELVVGLQKEFGVVISDQSVGQKVLVSINTIVEFIKSQTKEK